MILSLTSKICHFKFHYQKQKHFDCSFRFESSCQFIESLEYRFQIEARKKEIKSTKMADGKVKKSLERDGIKPLRIEIPAELQPGNHGLTETVLSEE